ncbi:MAG: glycosyltransferase family 4 protein [Dehalococcoidia bacterium]
MRVLYLITRAEYGGGQVHLVDLLRGFRDRFDLALGVGEEDYLTVQARQLGVPVYLLPNLVQPVHPWKDLRALNETRTLIRRVQPDLIHAHTSKAGLVGRVAARIAGVPAVFTAHTWAFAEGVSWRRKLIGVPSEWLATRCSARIINVSEANQAVAMRYRAAPAQVMTVIHNGVPDTPWRARPAEGDQPRIVMVARFSPQKDQQLLLRALAGLDCPFRLALVGDGPLRADAEAEARRLGLEGRVDFLGSRNDVAEILAAASIFALATNWEGFPLSILEAMRAGLPVVASDVGGVAEAVVAGETGFVVPFGDVHALRGRIVQLLGDPALRARAGAAGRARYEQRFTLDGMLERTAAIYTKVAR